MLFNFVTELSTSMDYNTLDFVERIVRLTSLAWPITEKKRVLVSFNLWNALSPRACLNLLGMKMNDLIDVNRKYLPFNIEMTIF